MALRKIETLTGEAPDRKAVVYRDTEWDEFRVKFHQGGVYLAKADYHTEDKEDALDTARSFAEATTYGNPGDPVCLRQPIPNHKQVCRDMAPEGWSYGGFDEGYYLFTKGHERGCGYGGYLLMECLEEDLTAANLQLMARMGLSRDRDHEPN